MLWSATASVHVRGRPFKSASNVGAVVGVDEWEKELPRISGKSKLAEAIRYATSRRFTLERFFIDGRVEIESNIVERAIIDCGVSRCLAITCHLDGKVRRAYIDV